MSNPWIERRSGDCVARNGDTRTQYQRDYGRIVHSASFRRLQSKTQVLGLGESDFYRTRLTHSMEVAQIASGITLMLKEKGEKEGHDWLKHLPYGHAGEVALNYVMKEHGGFEGNAQTLRILSKLEKYKVNVGTSYGNDVTRRTLLGVIKYPCTYSAVNNPKRYDGSVNNVELMKEAQFKPPKCYYDDEKEVFDWVISPFSDSDKVLFQQSMKNIKEDGSESDTYGDFHLKPRFKALDTSIMELADDISYSIHDLEDAISLDMVVQEDWDDITSQLDGLEIEGLDAAKIGKELFSKGTSDRKQMISELVNFFVTNVNVELKNSDFNDPLLQYQATFKKDVRGYLDAIHKGLTVKKVIKDRNVQLLQFKGQMLVVKLFEALANDPERFLLTSTYELYKKAKGNEVGQMRIICDYVSGMTDAYATKLYEKLYIPNRGSVFDKL